MQAPPKVPRGNSITVVDYCALRCWLFEDVQSFKLHQKFRVGEKPAGSCIIST